jgi:hypothetical protein
VPGDVITPSRRGPDRSHASSGVISRVDEDTAPGAQAPDPVAGQPAGDVPEAVQRLLATLYGDDVTDTW